MQLTRISLTAKALLWASLVPLAAGSASEARAQAAKATFVPDGSFELQPKGRPAAPDKPVALTIAPDGKIHLADGDGLVHVFDANGGRLVAYGKDQLDRPLAIAMSVEGHAFVLDGGDKQIVVFGQDGQVLRRIGESGGRAGQLADPVDIALGPSGYVYVLDPGRKGIQIFSWDGTFIRDIPFGQTVKEPMSVAVGRDGTIYVADKKSPTFVFAFPAFTELPWSGEVPAGVAVRINYRGADFDEPVAMGVNENGTVVVLDKKAGRLFRKNTFAADDTGPNDMLYGGIGTGRGSFRNAVDFAFAGSEEILILDENLRKVERIRLTTEEGLSPRPMFGFPVRVTKVARGLPAPLLAVGYDQGGAPLFLTEMEKRGVQLTATEADEYPTVYDDTVRAFHPDPRALQTRFGEDVGEIGAAAVSDTMVVIADSRRNRFAIFGLAGGSPLGTYGDNYQDDRKLKDPTGVAVLPDGRIIIADKGNNRVKVFSPDLASLVASYAVNRPAGVAIDQNGDIYVWSENGGNVGRLDPHEGDLEPLPPQLVPGPVKAMTFDKAGNLYMLDQNTQRVTIIEAGLSRILIQLGAEGELDDPTRIVVDDAGNVYISDEGSGRTVTYRWDIHSPPLSGLRLDYEGEVAVLNWSAGPERFTRGYEIQGADAPEGPFQTLVATEAPTFRLDPANQSDSPPRYVRVAPVFTTGVRGKPTETMPLSYFAATAAYQNGDYDVALQDATEGIRLIDDGILAASDDVKGKLLRLAFASSFRLGEFNQALTWAQRAAQIPMPKRDLVQFLFMLSDLYLRTGRPREASQQVLALVGEGPNPEYYSEPLVIQRSFRVYRMLSNAGYEQDALEFLRLYEQSMPETVPDELRYVYQDSIVVYSTRHKLADGIEYWKSADYGQVVAFFEGLLTEGGLSSEERVISWQILAAAYYAFGRRAQAEDTFKQIYGVRPSFSVSREIPRLDRLYALQIYNQETRQFFGNVTPG